MKPARLARVRRAGVALPAAIIALVLLSTLVAGALFVSTEELRSGRSNMADQRALAAAEWALARAIVAWDARHNTSQVVGAREIVDERDITPNDHVVVTATRVQRNAVWMTAAATSRGDGRAIPARHMIAASLRLVGASVGMRAALTAAGAVSVSGGVIDGRDSAVDDASGLCIGDTLTGGAGVSVPDASQVTCADCASSLAGVFGNPPIDSSLEVPNDSAFARFGDETAATLAGRASIVIDGGTVVPRPAIANGECDRADPVNWGDLSHTGPCGDHYPIVHVRGSVVLGPGSVGQGILIVDGSLRVEANARFAGVVVVSDDIAVVGIGAEIRGVAFAGDADRAGGSRVADGGAIRLTSCAVRRATLGTARLTRTPERWWTELR